MRAMLAILLGASAGGCSQLSADQSEILQAVASDTTGSVCLKPVLRGEVGRTWARIPPRGFDDLARDMGQPDLRLSPGQLVGRMRVVDTEDCFTALVPRVSGDRAMAALFARPMIHIEFGLRRQNGRWIIVERSSPDI